MVEQVCNPDTCTFISITKLPWLLLKSYSRTSRTMESCWHGYVLAWLYSWKSRHQTQLCKRPYLWPHGGNVQAIPSKQEICSVSSSDLTPNSSTFPRSWEDDMKPSAPANQYEHSEDASTKVRESFTLRNRDHLKNACQCIHRPVTCLYRALYYSVNLSEQSKVQGCLDISCVQPRTPAYVPQQHFWFLNFFQIWDNWWKIFCL